MSQYEYRTVAFCPGEAADKTLTQLGSSGWRVVLVVKTNGEQCVWTLERAVEQRHAEGMVALQDVANECGVAVGEDLLQWAVKEIRALHRRRAETRLRDAIVEAAIDLTLWFRPEGTGESGCVLVKGEAFFALKNALEALS